MTTWHAEHKESLSFGQRSADALRNAMGSWWFIWGSLVIIGCWMGLNVYFLIHPFDRFPFILLNLMLSTMAAIQAPIILMSQKRQDQTSAALAESDHRTALETKRELDEVKKMLIQIASGVEEVRLREEIREL